jgi:signal transduction histidine kinase
MNDNLRGRRDHTPVLVLVLSMLLTGLVTAVVASMSSASDDDRFNHAVDGANDRINTRLAAYITLLRAGAAHISASESVTPAEFETFVRRFRIPDNYPGIQGVGYTARVRAESADSLSASQRAGGFPDFRVWPAEPIDGEVHSILYLFPLDRRNQAAIGYNMFSEERRRAAMIRAAEAGTSVMTERVRLVQEIAGPAQAGFLIYTPVYPGGELPDDPAARRAILQGYVYAPFRADDLFEGIFGSEEAPHVAIRVYDGAAVDPGRLLHDSRVHGVAALESPRFQAVERMETAGRTWTVVFTSTAAFEEQTGGRLWMFILGLGLATSVFLFLVTGRQVAARAEAESLALRLGEATGELERQVLEVRALNEELESANDALTAGNARLEELRHEADAARDEAHAANQAKSEFLAAMSHELRTPLNAIMGYADLLDMGIHGPVTPEQRDALRRIRRSQVHLLALINDVLNYARLEAGRVELSAAIVPLPGVLADLRAMTDPQLQERGLTAEYAACSDDLAAWGDPDKIQQILLNLLTNAIKFTDPGGRIRVECGATETEVRIAVEDTGVGVPADRLQSIFEPFVQVDRQRGEDGRHGVGLGLAISSDLARLMEGDLTAESEPGRGSRFTLTLPRGLTTSVGGGSEPDTLRG